MRNNVIILLILSTLTAKAQKNMIIEKEKIVDASIDQVWYTLTNKEKIKKWLGVTIVTNWEVGGQILFKFSWDGKNYVDKGKLIGFDENKRFEYQYWSHFSGLPDKPENYTNIAFYLEKSTAGTKLKLIHSGIKNETMYEHSDKNWEETLNQITSITTNLKE